MSMLSAQADKLRDMAVSIGLEMPQAATLMMDAADTISELRDDLQRANAENAKLRAARDVWAENDAKLRELVSGLEYCTQGFVCDRCPLYDPLSTNHRRCESLERELGIEVDDD